MYNFTEKQFEKPLPQNQMNNYNLKDLVFIMLVLVCFIQK